MVDTDNKVGLTEEEKELYDRQIRLWGLESQKRLRSAKVVLIGMNSVCAEVAKNIILAGVDKITLVDSKSVTEEDLSNGQFLVPHESIGKNRANASVERAQALNPLVKVCALEGDWESNIPKETDIVVATGLGANAASLIGDKCRDIGARLLFCDVVGLFGFMLGDLKKHEYSQEIDVALAKKLDLSGKRGKVEYVKEVVKRVADYPTIKEVLSPNWTAKNFSTTLSKIDPAYFVFSAILQFRDEFKRDPCPETEEEDFKLLKELTLKAADKAEFAKEKIPDGLIRICLRGPVNPVSAVLGGVVGQEAIRVLSQVDPPLNNVFIYDAARNSGRVLTISPASPTSLPRKISNSAV